MSRNLAIDSCRFDDGIHDTVGLPPSLWFGTLAIRAGYAWWRPCAGSFKGYESYFAAIKGGPLLISPIAKGYRGGTSLQIFKRLVCEAPSLPEEIKLRMQCELRWDGGPRMMI